jgi:hypothetical protein
MNGDRVVNEVKRVFDDVGAVAERLKADGLAREEPLRPGGFAPLGAPAFDPGGEDLVVRAARIERDRVVSDGVAGLAKVAEGRENDLDARERFGLEAIVLLEGRPAILIQEGDFFPPPREWSRLADDRERICAVIASCGRIEVKGHLNLDWLGTASLVAPTTLMTNRHVAQEFSSRAGERWTFRPHMTSGIDFLEELGSTASLRFEITETIGIHDQHDFALLRVESTSSGGETLPDPLAVAASEPPDLFGRDVYAVGYPCWDGRRNEPESIRRIFTDIYNVKRLQPGKAVAYSTQYSAVQHDCSTLGGNSGSPVVDLETHQVIGLHFGGRYGVGNYAVPLWMLAGDPLLEKGDLNFQ